MKMFITEQQAQALLKARKLSTLARKAEKKRIIAEVKRQHGIPSGTKLVFFIESPNNPIYRVIRDKRTKMPLDNGVQEPAKPVVKAQPQVIAKSPAKKAAPVKAVAKKVPIKKTPAKKATPAATYPKDVRITHNGSRVRLGKAKDAAHEKRLIAAYKKANG